jgi:hypothetical protein
VAIVTMNAFHGATNLGMDVRNKLTTVDNVSDLNHRGKYSQSVHIHKKQGANTCN